MPRLTHRNLALGSRRALVVAALLAVLLPVAGTGSASGGDDRDADVPRQAASNRDGRGASGSFELLQMNLCLSGLAGCFDGTEYPKVVDEAIAKIDAVRPDAVTFNEACSGDVADIAAATGYHMRFATVIYGGEPLPCVDPGDRGVFGNAVLTAAPIRRSHDAAFTTQSGSEERRWICATTTERVSVCATHLSTRGGTDGPATNDAQCAELTDILRRYGRRGPTVFAGDVNRDPSCAPDGWWTLTDADAEQLPGIQHAYGTERWFGAPRAEIHPATYTDHDFLVATADQRGGRGPHQRFDLQAHRGGVGLTTESTLAGFAKAIELGVTTLELDTQVTEDGKVVITHDRQISADKCRDTDPAFEGDPEFPYVGKYINDAHALGLKVIPWTINDAETMDYFIDLGVDGIITDYPDRLRQVMADNGLPLPKPY